MSWIAVALGAYLFLAFANLIDKFLVDNIIKSSRAYTFIVCLLGLAMWVVAPWFLTWPGIGWFLFFLLAGILFAIALLFLYEALRRGEASRVLVIIGGSTPIFSFLLSWFLWKEMFDWRQIMGFCLLIIGIFVIAWLPIYQTVWEKFIIKLGFQHDKRDGGLGIAVLSGLFYSLYFISSKHAYNYHEFVNVFLWTRIGAVILTLFFLLNKDSRQQIIKVFKPTERTKRGGLVISNQLLGSTGFILQNYAISLGPVAIINALQGFQYALIMIFSAIGASIWPALAQEEFKGRILWQKIIAIIFIALGLFFVAA